jgi:HlyD family type I secretion membrane fusion protein
MEIIEKLIKKILNFFKNLEKFKNITELKIFMRNNLSKFIHFISNEPVKAGVVFIYLFFIITILWSCFAKLDSASVGQGIVVLDANQKIIQHFEGGIIEKIFVKDGDLVKAGQELILLNKISANSNIKLLYSEFFAEKAREARLVSEKDSRSNVMFDVNLISDKIEYETRKTLDTQKFLFKSRQTEMFNKIRIFENQAQQLKEEINGFQAQKRSAEGQLLLLRKEEKIVRGLVEDGYETQTRLFALQRNIEELKGSVGNFVALIAKARQEINKLKLNILDLRNERNNDILKELHETQMKINDLHARIMNAEDILDRVMIKTAYSGIVSDMKFYTVGGVIPPHADIMTIIPQNDELIIESKLNPQDIDVVQVGLQAKVNLSAYKARYVPALMGEVVYVAPDKITDPATKMSYYVIRIKIDEASEKNKIIMTSKNIKLYPGMPAEVFVITGKRTFLSYLLDPVKKTFRRGFKED